ncbi:MAG: gcrA cell cycle regulator family protein [Rhodospirillales bacterium]|nr:gcrA cell cycle regulator family protein [Rhodospirillales bacterium]MCB9965751.1 gcrA cell cycle regulator family protein [Rhodospirillales bacterium]MCB9979679.1 gcrA cell cycle regulator family protein [Rhodospirillales bacterium]
MSWTEERVALLEKLWGEGKTASEIAKIIGDVSRNAVIGKAHRLKLSGRASPIQAQGVAGSVEAGKPVTRLQEPSNSNIQPARRGRPKKQLIEPSADIPVKHIKLTDLKDRQCRWPLGDPRDEDFSFCGCQAMPGVPYCAAHAQVAYQVATRKKFINLEVADDSGARKKADEEIFENLKNAG